LKLSVDLFHPKIKQEEVVVDTTVQEINIGLHTDAKLGKKVIDSCRKIAIKEDISLRQSYSRTAPDLFCQASSRESTRQKKKALKATRRIRTIGSDMLRDLFCFSRNMIKIKSTLSMILTLSVLQKARLTNIMNLEPKFPSPKHETAELSLVL
jgi:hypothetical protein